MEKQYKPISCSYYDYLEAFIVGGKKHNVKYYDPEGIIREVHIKLHNLRTENGEEFLILENKEEIRLDRLIAIDSIHTDQFPSSC